MRRISVIALLLAAAPVTGAAAQRPQRPPLKAALETCHTGQAPTDRFAVFTGSMPAIRGARRMWMRFDLFERTPGAHGFARIALPKWGVWEKSSRTGAAGFIFTKRVEQLVAPARYRAVVQFRWYGAHGKLLRRARRVSRTCAQPDPRPDLSVGRVGITPAGAYAVVVHNDGHGDAGPFVLTIGSDRTLGSADVPGVPAGESRLVAVPGERCRPGEPIRITVDSGRAVAESREGNDVAARVCPFAGR